MPPFIAFAIAGVGIYAGLKWVTRELQRASAERASGPSGAEGNAAHAHGHAGADARHMPKDLGTLEWDAATGVYRPRKETAN